MTGVVWTLLGCPTAALANASASLSVACAPGTPLAHSLSLPGGPSLAIDVGGRLRAGYVYRAAAQVSLAASPAWAGGPLIGGNASAAPPLPGAPSGAVGTAVAALSASVQVAHPAPGLPVLALVAAPASALWLATHTPPQNTGALVLLEAGPGAEDGVLRANYSLRSPGWVAWGAGEAAAALGGPAPSAAAAALWLLTAVPLSDSAACDAAELYNSGAPPLALVAGSSGACEVSVPSLSAGPPLLPLRRGTLVNVTGAPPAVTAPVWLLHLGLAAQLSSGAPRTTPRPESTQGLCGLARSFASAVVSTRAAGADPSAPASPDEDGVRVYFRLASGADPDPSLPLLPSGSPDPSAVLRSQTLLRPRASWSGAPLAAPVPPAGRATALLVPMQEGQGGGSAARTAPPRVAGNGSATVCVYAFVVDALGGVSVAAVTTAVPFPLSQDQGSDAAAVSAFAASQAAALLSGAAVAAQPHTALLAAASVGSALAGASSSTLAAGLDAAAALRAANSQTRAIALSVSGVRLDLPGVFAATPPPPRAMTDHLGRPRGHPASRGQRHRRRPLHH